MKNVQLFPGSVGWSVFTGADDCVLKEIVVAFDAFTNSVIQEVI